jgi:hypothetical protein
MIKRTGCVAGEKGTEILFDALCVDVFDSRVEEVGCRRGG